LGPATAAALPCAAGSAAGPKGWPPLDACAGSGTGPQKGGGTAPFAGSATAGPAMLVLIKALLRQLVQAPPFKAAVHVLKDLLRTAPKERGHPARSQRPLLASSERSSKVRHVVRCFHVALWHAGLVALASTDLVTECSLAGWRGLHGLSSVVAATRNAVDNSVVRPLFEPHS
jgi:hypothetical protein